MELKKIMSEANNPLNSAWYEIPSSLDVVVIHLNSDLHNKTVMKFHISSKSARANDLNSVSSCALGWHPCTAIHTTHF